MTDADKKEKEEMTEEKIKLIEEINNTRAFLKELIEKYDNEIFISGIKKDYESLSPEKRLKKLFN